MTVMVAAGLNDVDDSDNYGSGYCSDRSGSSDHGNSNDNDDDDDLITSIFVHHYATSHDNFSHSYMTTRS